MEKRAEIVLKGRLQKAGYRDYIDEVAFDLNLKGCVKNLEDGTVKVVCEGRSKDIEEFINKIKILLIIAEKFCLRWLLQQDGMILQIYI